jgi:hypothetical protein
MRQATDIAAARAAVDLGPQQCMVLHELLCQPSSCVLLQPLQQLTMSNLCQLLSPLSHHSDLLQQWKAAISIAATRLCSWRGVKDLDWNEVSQKVLEPSVKKPLHIRFNITCLDVSCNVDTCLSVSSSPPCLRVVGFSGYPLLVDGQLHRITTKPELALQSRWSLP